MFPARETRWPILLALLAVYVIWGSTYLAIKFALAGLPPLLMAGIRFLVPAAVLYVFLRWRGAPPPTMGQWRASALMGTLLLAGGNGAVCEAEQWVGSGLAALVIATVPILTVLFSRIWGQRTLAREWVGLGIGFTGMVLLNFEGDMQASPLGAFLLLFAAASWSLGSAWSKYLDLPDGMMRSATQMLAGGVVLLLAGLSSGERVAHVPDALPVLALLYLMVFGSVIAFSAYLYLLKHTRPALATSYAYANPIIAVVLGVGFGGESISAFGMLALGVILLGVGLVSVQARPSSGR
jgi:drug/metabolite transporter (DMT)-like permease